MTHAELTAADTKGFASACPSDTRVMGSYPDTLVTEAGTTARRIYLHSCEGCGRMIAEAVAEDGRKEILNVYRPVDPKRVARDLAEALRADVRAAGKEGG